METLPTAKEERHTTDKYRGKGIMQTATEDRKHYRPTIASDTTERRGSIRTRHTAIEVQKNNLTMWFKKTFLIATEAGKRYRHGNTSTEAGYITYCYGGKGILPVALEKIKIQLILKQRETPPIAIETGKHYQLLRRQVNAIDSVGKTTNHLRR